MTATTDKAVHKFSIIRYRGRPNFAKVQLANGKVLEIERVDSIRDPRTGWIVPVAPYDNHFVFELPTKIPGPRWQCTCGSLAGYVGSKVYAHDASPQGALMVCLYHAEHGIHADGETKWV